MRVLVLDPKAYALAFCVQCLNAGHQVKWFVRPGDDRCKCIGRGLVERVSEWEPWMKWADLVFLPDNVLYLQQLQWYFDHGYPIFGCNNAGAELELNRDKGMAVLNDAGVETIPGKSFDDYDRAEAFVKREMKRFVSKPSGDADKALSYVSKSPADMIYMLRRWKKLGSLKKAPFIMQEFCAGTEMAVGAFFGPGGWSSPWLENWEFKKLMNGDLGVATGEQGTVIRYVKKSKLADKVLKPVTEYLHSINYVGYVDVNCIIDDGGQPWPLEFTCRPGWPLFNIQQALLTCDDPAAWMVDVLQGGKPRVWVEAVVAIGVVMSIPDYPYSHITRKEVVGVPVYNLTFDDLQRFQPCEIQMAEAPSEENGKIVDRLMPCTAGDYLLVTNGVGASITSAQKQAYKAVKELSIPNSPMYRTDIGNRLKKQLPILQKNGFATGLSW